MTNAANRAYHGSVFGPDIYAGKRGKVPGAMILFHRAGAPEEALNRICTAANMTYIKAERIPIRAAISQNEIARHLNRQTLGLVCLWVDNADPLDKKIALAAARKHIPTVLYFGERSQLPRIDLCQQGRLGVMGVMFDFGKEGDALAGLDRQSFPHLNDEHITCASQHAEGGHNMSRCFSSLVRWY